MGVGQITVVSHHQTKRRVHVKRLRLLLTFRVACRGVAHLSQTGGARQRAHVAGSENVTHHALGLVHIKLSSRLRHNTGRILPTVLQKKECIVNQLIYGCATQHANNSTHLR